MFTKAIAKALVIVLTVGMTSLIGSPSSAMIFADSLTLSAATASQEIGETATSNSPVASILFLGQYTSDTYSVVASLVSAPAGNTRLPALRLIETTAAIVFGGDPFSPYSIGAVVASNTQAKISPKEDVNAAVGAKFQVYMDAASVAGAYVVKLTPAMLGGGGTINASALTLTIYVGVAPPQPSPEPSQSSSPNIRPLETSTPDTYTVAINVTTTSSRQLTSTSQTLEDLYINLNSYSSGAGDTSSVSAFLISAPAGNTALPILELVSTTNSKVDDSAQLDGELSNGAAITTQYAYMTGLTTPGSISSRFKLYLKNPKKVGTYVIKVQPRITSGAGTAPINGLMITFTVMRDPATYPAMAEVVISIPGDITNKSDAEINAVMGDSSEHVAVIRTVMKSSTGQTSNLDSYTASIFGPGTLGVAPLSMNMLPTRVGSSVQVRIGDAVTVHTVGIPGEVTVVISNYDGIEVGRKRLNFINIPGGYLSFIALSFSSFPEKGTPVTLSATVNLPGTVRFTTNGKTLGSCARISSGLGKPAVCRWKPPVSGQLKITATFTPSDGGIPPVTLTKDLAVGRRSGRR